MARKIGYRWHLRKLMAERDMFATTDLRPLLAERVRCPVNRSTGWSPGPPRG